MPLLTIAHMTGTVSAAGWRDPLCMKDGCAWWNYHIGACGVVAQGMIQGAEVARQEQDDWPTDQEQAFDEESTISPPVS